MMNNNLIIILSDNPIDQTEYKGYDILNINKKDFGNAENEILWCIKALNYSNFLKNEIEFERYKGYDKVLLQRINDIQEINEHFLEWDGDIHNYYIYSDKFIQNSTELLGPLDIINPWNWLSNSLTFNIVSSMNSNIYYRVFKNEKGYWNEKTHTKFNFNLVFHSHCITHNIHFKCIK